MKNNYSFLFEYLEKEQITIDKKEFEFQIQSHPDYPSLLSIADTLTFFNIDNGALRVEVPEIDMLPYRFIALLKEENNKPLLTFIENKNENYFCINDNKTINRTRLELEKLWKDTVLLIEKPENEVTSTCKNNWSNFFPLLCFSLLGITLFQIDSTLQSKLFLIFPIIGLTFSFAAIKDLFDVKSELFNSFCNMTPFTSCAKVVDSNKWKIFEIINFSDLSIVFFATQFLGLMVFLFSHNTTPFFAIQQILLLAAVPVLLLSVYYQKFVEKKWCPICLVINSIIFLELGHLYVFQNVALSLSLKGIIVFGFVFISVMLTWSALKKLLTNRKELKEYQLKSLRFERNYTIFKNSLLTKNKVELPQCHLILGNKESETIITVISNPFCGHCKEAHEIIDAILTKHHNDVQIQVMLKTNLEAENEVNKKLFRSLVEIYKQGGETAFVKALKYWFDIKNIEKWFNFFTVNTSAEFDAIINAQFKWCEKNDYNFTPAIFINGYEYPQMYDRKNLRFYINELVEDSF